MHHEIQLISSTPGNNTSVLVGSRVYERQDQNQALCPHKI